MAADGAQKLDKSARVEFFVTALGPEFGLFGFGAVESFGEQTEMLFDVKPIDDLNRLGKQFIGDIPDPSSTISYDDRPASLSKAATRRLA
jgi:hypothetical protein